MQKRRQLYFLLVCSLVIAALAHFFFLKEWTNDRYMVGPNDGLQQMLTFKKLLYEQYSNGNFFYSSHFGLGGGTYSQLAYYFSTSFVFIITVCVVFLLQSFDLIGSADILFWANAAVFISIGRLAIILFMTTYVFHYMKSNWVAAFAGASFYGLSVMYFRHVIYWEFFADAMLWIPLLVLGVEKIIREARMGWFIFGVASTLFNNFYFAYINLIFVMIYIIFRVFICLEDKETNVWSQLKLYVCSGILGFGISAVSFIPAVYGFLNNHRPPYNKPIPFFHWDNILFKSPYLIIPTIFLIFLFVFSLYKNRAFQLFSVFSIIFIILHFSPVVASSFNGFSAPQYRWEYILSFTVGGAVAVGLNYVKKISLRELIISSFLVFTIYLFFVILDPKLRIFSLPSLFTLSLVACTIILLIVNCCKQSKIRYTLLITGVLLLNIVLVNTFQFAISRVGSVDHVTRDYLVSNKYNGREQLALLEQIKESDSDNFFRIDWRVGSLNNTPIVQDFNGISAYGSIINKHLLYLYLHDLDIDMGRESVSRYATFGDRANLYSLFQGKYLIREKDKTDTIPFGFKKMLESKHYNVYQNMNVLPFIRTTNRVYSETALEKSSPLVREYAMLEGVIISSNNIKTMTELPVAPNIIERTIIKTVGASYKGDRLSVKEEKGGIDLLVNETSPNTKDYYVSFELKSLARDQGFTLKINDYRTTRKSNKSIYKTYDDHLTIRVPKAETIKIRVPKGNYLLKDLALYEENYKKLEVAKKHASQDVDMNWSHHKLTITYNNQLNDLFMILPIPYERGWEVMINNEIKPVQKVNYSFIGFPIEKGMNHIQLIYYPPFFRISLIVTIISTIVSFLICKYTRKRKS
jgi:uncharacterized membrane protein YfhO